MGKMLDKVEYVDDNLLAEQSRAEQSRAEQSRAEQSRAERLVGLDLLRIFSVLVIFFFHTGHIGCSYGLLRGFVGQGAILMTAFFMLSGFVLHYTSGTRKLFELDGLKKFYIKRFVSILPCYWIVAIIYTIYSVVFAGSSFWDNLILIPVEVFGLQSVFCSVFNISHNDGTWFVSCILLCYAVFPLLQQIIEGLTIRCKIILYLLLVGILFYSPIVVEMLGLDNIYSNPFFRICEFALGIILCCIWKQIKSLDWYKKYIARYWSVCVAIILLVGGVSVARLLNIPSVNYMLYSWIGIPCFTLMMLSLCGLKFVSIADSRILKYCIESSYVFFFAQFFTWPVCKILFKLIGNIDEISTLVKMPIAFMICCLITIFMHEIIEKPITRKMELKLLK